MASDSDYESEGDYESDYETESESNVKLKLLIDTKANKVLFAEGGKDFVDFLFHIMSLPVGTIIKLLNVDGMVGSLGSLYKSIESLNTDYFQPNLTKDSVLKPKTPVSVPLLSLNDSPTLTQKQYYRCSYYNSRKHNIYKNISQCNIYYTDCCGTACGNCNREMTTKMSYVCPTASQDNANSSSNGTGSGGGYVKGVVTYMVMDNLEVKPMSNISGITLMNKFHVKDVSALVEKEVQLGLKEGLAMLKASLETKTVLTSVFLGKQIYGLSHFGI